MSERQWIGDGQTLSVRLKSKVNLSIYASPSRALKVNGKSVDWLTKVKFLFFFYFCKTSKLCLIIKIQTHRRRLFYSENYYIKKKERI